MLSALADRGIRRPRRILIGALVTFVVAAVLGGPVAGQLDSANGFEDPGSSSVAAREAIQRASGVISIFWMNWYCRPSKPFTASAARIPRPAVRASSSSTHVSMHNGCRLICR